MPRPKKIVEEAIETEKTPVTEKEKNVVVYDGASKTIVCIPVSQLTANHKPI